MDRWNLSSGAARPNPQGSFHYGVLNVTRTIQLQNTAPVIGGKQRFAVNGVSFIYPDTPLKLADYFQINNIFTLNGVPDSPTGQQAPGYGTPVIDAVNRAFVQIVFENPEDTIQTWHVDGYAFFIVGMDRGDWDRSKQSTYNLIDAVSRSTTQVFPKSWTAIMLELDNVGMWNVRSEDGVRRYLGQELYMRVTSTDNPAQSEDAPPANGLFCGRANPAPH
uniref:TSA: Wollemia nobilis Ref_Wollemi_Transcript_9311_853 transcribed RNA sequence n=1 Tax=Wollemia nobilis TaxID=56998 RepID=A0A0C9QUB8_9CONI